MTDKGSRWRDERAPCVSRQMPSLSRRLSQQVKMLVFQSLNLSVSKGSSGKENVWNIMDCIPVL